MYAGGKHAESASSMAADKDCTHLPAGAEVQVVHMHSSGATANRPSKHRVGICLDLRLFSVARLTAGFSSHRKRACMDHIGMWWLWIRLLDREKL
jgi:hypothetical protein